MNDIGSVPHAGVLRLICIHNYHVLFSDEQSSGGVKCIPSNRVLLEKNQTDVVHSHS